MPIELDVNETVVFFANRSAFATRALRDIARTTGSFVSDIDHGVRFGGPQAECQVEQQLSAAYVSDPGQDRANNCQ
jgi:hypothetical protein